METSRIHWKELQKFFASGAAIRVSAKLDLVEVALQMHDDNKAQFESWLATGVVSKVTDAQAAAWLTIDAEVWAVVVSPWVLVQEIRVLNPNCSLGHKPLPTLYAFFAGQGLVFVG